MEKYVCSICGYIYDEKNGIPKDGIAAGTKWESLPDDWVCPLCGAGKAEFDKQKESIKAIETKPIPLIEESTKIKKMSPLEISILCTNLARGCEQQYKSEEAALFTQLSEYYKTISEPAQNPNFDKLISLIEKDIDDNFSNANLVSSEAEDRGALRALAWSEKVTRILKSLLIRYEKEGDSMLENTDIWVCTICGFIYVGDISPDVCPICKAPNWKFEKVEGGSENV